MVQILPAVQPKPSFSSQLGLTLGSGLSQGITTGLEKAEQKKQLLSSQAAINKLTGMDVSGINDPKVLQEIVKQSIKGQELRKLFDNLKGGINESENTIGDQLRSGQSQGLPEFNETQNIPSTTKQKTNVPISQIMSDDDVLKLSLYSPQAADIVQKQRDAEYNRNKALWDYKPSQDFIKDVDEAAKGAMFSNEISDAVEKVIQNPETDPFNVRTLLASQFGETLPMLYTPGSAQLKFLEKLRASGLKEYFPKPTEREFFFLQSAQNQLGKTKEANQAIVDLQREIDSIPLRIAEIKNDIIQENGGAPPRDIAAKTLQKMAKIKDNIIRKSADISYKFGNQEDKQKSIAYYKENAPKGKVLMRLPGGAIGYALKSDVKQYVDDGAEVL